MGWRTIAVSKNCKLSYKNDYLIIRSEKLEMIHLSEINMIIIENGMVSITSYLINELANNKIKLIICNEKHNPSCEMVPYKVKKWLEENKIEFSNRNIVEDNPTYEELSKWITQSGIEVKKWFNTSGLKYKELNLKEKLITMSDEEKIKLLASNGMLIKRPLLISDNGIYAGFKQERWEEILNIK